MASTEEKKGTTGGDFAPRIRPNWKSLAGLGAATLFLALALFAAWQAWLILGEQDRLAAADAAHAEAFAGISQRIGAMRDRIGRALQDDAVRAALSLSPPDLAAATLLLRQKVPELDAAEFYDTTLQAVTGGDLAAFGYARASLLARAQAQSAPTQALLRRFDGKPALVQAWPITDAADAVLAFALVRWPAQPLLDRFAAVASPTRLELRQGEGNSDDEIIVAAGPETTGAVRDAGRQVAETRLRVVKAPPELPVVLPNDPAIAVAMALFGLIGFLVSLWVRKVGGQQAMRALRSKSRRDSGGENDDKTLTEMIEHNVISGMGVPTRKLPEPKRPAASVEITVDVDPGIFRSYDIRGVVGRSLSAEVAELLGRAIGSEARERGLGEIVVGRDGRLSGPELSAALIAGIRASGVDVIDIGLAPTPLVYFAGYHLNTGSGVAVTGSHNPPDYNGFKIVLGGETLSGDAITALHTRIVERRFSEGEGGLQIIGVDAAYVDRIAGDIQVQRRLKVVVDAGNGVAGGLAPAVLEAIGCEVIQVYCDVDGTFPNHHPDPSDPHNLLDLQAMVKKTRADIGLAFDGDGDRLGVVLPGGEIVYPDRVLMLYAADVLTRHPGSTIIYDVKCTGKLGPDIARNSGVPLMWKTGHSLIKAKMRETGALLAGEMSGHFFFQERWYGFDDGIYAAARLLEILANDGRKAQEVFDAIPKGVSTPELHIAMREGDNHPFVATFQKGATFDGARLTTIDGLRADWPDGWGLVRASNTTPVLVLRFDADNREALQRIQEQFRRELLKLAPKAKLPF